MMKLRIGSPTSLLTSRHPAEQIAEERAAVSPDEDFK
jgi:hypothetical protein